ncbi:MAG: LCP family protein [Actinomycetota bacterium]
MRIRNPFAVAAVCAALVTAACSPAESIDATTTAPTTSAAPATTATTSPPTTTTTTQAPLAEVHVTGDMPTELAAPIAEFLAVLQDQRNAHGILDPEFVAHHEAVQGSLDEDYTATSVVQELAIGGSVAVVTLDTGDIVLAAEEGAGWTVVGSHMKSVEADPWFGTSPRRVLVLGSDARPGFDAATHRMDSIHIVTAVPSQGKGTILGYPRDWWIDTPYGEMRINALTASGRGPDAIYNQFTEEWEIPLDGYILTAFSGFEKLIAASVGRLLITLPTSVPAQPWWDAFSAGEQKLTPTRTLDFARTRKKLPGGDFTRSWHQGLVMLAVLTMLQQGSVEDAPVLLGELVKYTETNLTPTDLIQLGVAAFYMDVGEITNEVLPGHLGRAGNGASVVFLEPEAEDIIADVIEDGIRQTTDD